MLELSVGEAHCLEDGVVAGFLGEHRVEFVLGVLLATHPEQGESGQHLGALEVRVLLQQLVGLGKGLLVVTMVKEVCSKAFI